jgi:molecular chaperone HscA
MLQDSIENAAADMVLRALVEARTEGEQLLAVTEKFMVKHQSLLSPEEVTQTALALQALQLSITMEDKNLIQAKIEALNETTRPFAERAMDEAVKGALKGKSI